MVSAMAITPIELNGLRDRAAWHVEVTEPVIVPLAAGTARAKLEALAQTAATRIRQALRALGLSNPATDNIVVGYADTQNGSYATTLHGRAPNAGSFMIPVVDFVRLQGASQAVRDASAPFIAESDPRISVKLQYVSFPKPGEARDLIRQGGTGAGQGQITLGPKYIPVQRKFSPGGQIIPSQTLILPNIQEFTLTQGQNESIEAMIARIQSFLRVPATLNAEVTATLDRAAAQAEAEAQTAREQAEAAAQTAREQAAADAARAAEDAARAEQAAAAAAQAAAAAAEAERLRAIAEAERVAAQAEEARRATLARDNAARQAANAEQQRQAENSAKWRTRGAVAAAILGVLGIGYAATRD